MTKRNLEQLNYVIVMKAWMSRFQYFDLPKQFLVHAKYVTRQPPPVKEFSTLDHMVFNIHIFLFLSLPLRACVLIRIFPFRFTEFHPVFCVISILTDTSTSPLQTSTSQLTFTNQKETQKYQSTKI